MIIKRQFFRLWGSGGDFQFGVVGCPNCALCRVLVKNAIYWTKTHKNTTYMIKLGIETQDIVYLRIKLDEKPRQNCTKCTKDFKKY